MLFTLASGTRRIAKIAAFSALVLSLVLSAVALWFAYTNAERYVAQNQLEGQVARSLEVESLADCEAGGGSALSRMLGCDRAKIGRQEACKAKVLTLTGDSGPPAPIRESLAINLLQIPECEFFIPRIKDRLKVQDFLIFATGTFAF